MRRVVVSAMLTLSIGLATEARSDALQAAAQRVALQARAMKASAQAYLDESRTKGEVTEEKDELIRRLAREHLKAADTINGFFKRQTNQGKQEMSQLERDIADDNVDNLQTTVTQILTERRGRIIEATVKLLQKVGEDERPTGYNTQPRIVNGELISEQVRDKTHEERELEKYCAAYSKVTGYLEVIVAHPLVEPVSVPAPQNASPEKAPK